MGKFGLSSYSLALSLSVRKDIVGYYSECVEETKKLHNDSKELAVRKGILIPPPVLPKPKEVDYVERQSFMRGYFGHRRPLLAVEIGNLHYNSERNALGQAVIIGFSQVAKHKDVRKYFERGRDKRSDVFTYTEVDCYSEARTVRAGKRLYVSLVKVSPAAGTFPVNTLLGYNLTFTSNRGETLKLGDFCCSKFCMSVHIIHQVPSRK